MATRNDVASISINLTLPPEVIKTYFDGMAKVEASKSKTSSFEWGSLVPLIPLVLPFLTGSTSAGPRSTSKTPASPKKSSDSKETSKESSSPSATSSEESEPVVLEAMAATGDQVKEADEGMKAISSAPSSESNPSVAESSTPQSSTDTGPITIPLPGGGPPLTVDLSSLGMGGNSAMNEMLKNFMPMLEGFTSAFGPPKATVPTASSSNSSENIPPAEEKKKEETDATPIETISAEDSSAQTPDLN